MGLENMNGKMEESMKDNTNLIKNMALDNIHGQMVEGLMDNGSIAKGMGKEKLFKLMGQKNSVYGKTTKE
jgi:hypothetical protein